MGTIQFPEIPDASDGYFGTCPKCRKTDGYLNIGQEHWSLCDSHKTCWLIGSNLFSGWQSDTEADWRRTADKLAYFTKVEPHYRGRR